MLRRLRSMIAWNERYWMGRQEFDRYYGSLAPRTEARGEARRDMDLARYRINFRL